MQSISFEHEQFVNW